MSLLICTENTTLQQEVLAAPSQPWEQQLWNKDRCREPTVYLGTTLILPVSVTQMAMYLLSRLGSKVNLTQPTRRNSCWSNRVLLYLICGLLSTGCSASSPCSAFNSEQTTLDSPVFLTSLLFSTSRSKTVSKLAVHCNHQLRLQADFPDTESLESHVSP